MTQATQSKISCNYCKQAVSNQNFLEVVEGNNSDSFNDWKITIVFYCGLHYMKSYASANKVELHSHKDFNEKTISQGVGLSPVLIIDGKVRADYIKLRRLSYHARYDGLFSDKISKRLTKGRLKDSKEYLKNVQEWIIPNLEKKNIETCYSL